MKAWAGNYLAIWLLVFIPTVMAMAQPDPESYLKTYDTSAAKIRAGFIPYKTQIVQGEPEQVTFFVENLGSTNFDFMFSWNHRGAPGHDTLKIVITDSNGKLLPDSYPNVSGDWMSSMVGTKSGNSFSNIIDLTDFYVLNKPGVYNVDCSFKFSKSWKGPEPRDLVARTAFTLTILKRTPSRVAKVLDGLVQQTTTKHGGDLSDTMSLIANFGKDDAVPRLARLAKAGPIEIRVAALGALPQVPTDASLDILLRNLKDLDSTIQSASATALGTMPQPHALQALLHAFPREKPPVKEAILLALGTTKSDRAFPVITNAFDTGDLELQSAAVGALGAFGGSNAVLALEQWIDTNHLSLRYAIVVTLGDHLGQSIQAVWLAPILAGHERNEQDSEWLDSLRLVRMYAGDQATPALLSFLDYDVPWSGRNWWILNQVEASPNAPHVNYEHDYNSDGTPEQWTNDIHVLKSLKLLAALMPTYPPPPLPPPIPNLKTDPPIEFTPKVQEIEDGGFKITSGFLTISLWRNGAYSPYSVSDPYKLVYSNASRFRALPKNWDRFQRLKITPEQEKRLNDLLHQFAVKLCGSNVSEQRIGNFYNSLVYGSDYCPCDDDWSSMLWDYKEAPPGPLRARAWAELLNSIQAFNQNYHSGTIEFTEAARKIFTPAQLQQILG